MLKTKVSSKGQVTVPKVVRQQLGIEAGAELEVTVENQAIRLQKMTPRWRQWSGALEGSDLLRELEREHRAEIERDERRRFWTRPTMGS
jgi:AbrB family looped-hinge helix DNA binding protein